MDLKTVTKVAHLARLEMSEADLVKMAAQLTAILSYVDQLSALQTENVEPLAHPLPIQNVFRDDEPRESLPIGDVLKNAPVRIGDFFGVPAILDAGDDMSH